MKLRHVLALGAATVTCLLLPAAAGAHAYVLSTDPPDGSRLDSSPRQIRLVFTEDVSAKLSRVKLTGARTGTVQGTTAKGSGTSLVVSVPELARDTYSLYWLTVSASDLHITRGVVAFSVGTAAPLPAAKAGPASASTGTDPGEVALRWLDFGAIAGLIGALMLIGFCIPRVARQSADGLDAARRRLTGAAAGFGAAALATGIGLLLAQASGVGGGSTGSALGTILVRTSYGPTWIAREVLVAVLLGTALVLGRRRPSATLGLLAGLGSLALCAALAANSHAGAIRGQVSVATGVLALHLFAAAAWTGGVCALALVLIGRWRTDHGPAARRLLRSFGGVATLGVAVVAITGLYSAGVDIASPDALVSTFYGRTLLLKTVLFLVVGLVGLANSLLVRTQRRPGRWLGRGVRLEAALVGAVILLAALLTASAPARGPQFLPASTVTQPQPRDAVRSVRAGDLLVAVAVKPNQPGVNFVTAGVFDTRRPAPGPVTSVDLSVSRGRKVEWSKAGKVGEDQWVLVSNQLARPGTWAIGVRVRREGLSDQVATIRWALPTLRPVAPVARTVISKRPLSPLLTTAAAIAALLLLATLLVLWLRRRSRSMTRSRESGHEAVSFDW